MTKVYALIESKDDKPFETVDIVDNETLAKKWIEAKFIESLRNRRILESDEEFIPEQIPDSWKITNGYTYGDYTCQYKEFKLITTAKQLGV